MKLIKKQIFILFLSTLFLAAQVQAEDDGKGFFDGEDVIWQSGKNVYFKYEALDTKKYGLNDHPVDLNEKDISVALESLIVWDKEYLTTEEGSTPVFSIRETNRLGKFIAKGLKRARPDQDIVFVTENVNPKLLILKDKAFNSGRAFFKDGKLNIIIGEYNRYRNEAFERAYDPGGQAKLPYFLTHGSRTSSTGAFNEAIIKVPGVENMKQDKTRRDWFVIDVELAAESYLAQLKAKQNPQGEENRRLLDKQAAQLARERREMRLEMARLRKELDENNGSGSANGGQSLEERLQTLDELRDKELITREEYETKRQEILNEI